MSSESIFGAILIAIGLVVFIIGLCLAVRRPPESSDLPEGIMMAFGWGFIIMGVYEILSQDVVRQCAICG